MKKIILSLFLAMPLLAQSVYVADISGMVDQGMVTYLKRVIQQADSAGADILVLEINTFGGRVDAATEIKDLIFDSKMKTVAFVNKRAISAGAFIAISCEKVIMTPGSLMGASTVVNQQGEKMSEKSQSYMRTEMAASAEARGRNTEVARGMVDDDIEIDSLTTKGKLITLSADECLQWNMADYKANSLTEGLEKLGYTSPKITRVSVSTAEDILRFITSPFISGLLLTIGFLGLIFEVKTPGWGVGGSVGLAALVVFFGANYIIDLAEVWEILLFVVGVGLLAVEIFVIPGFGLAGLGGITLMLVSVFLGMVGNWPTIEEADITNTLLVIAISFFGSFGLAAILLKYVPKSGIWNKISLAVEEKTADGFISNPKDYSHLEGKTGVAKSTLRPTGIAEFSGKRYDVVSEGDYIAEGEQIRVVKIEQYRIIVNKIKG